MAEKLKMHSADIIGENISFIESRFPNAIVEAYDDEGKLTKKVDFEILKQELSHVLISDKQERYQMTWPDKKKSILNANSAISATFRPCKEKSEDFDKTQNIYIEGDNLDVLKLLRETYLGTINMIYIDPPYNTGNDFVYNDNFAKKSDDYLANSGQYDEQGNRLVANTESNGRFHTDWLNMMYPRLKIAKDLLSEDGAIFISIDDNEVFNLKKICDEVFGEDNFVACIMIKANPRGRQSSSYIAQVHDYLLIYKKSDELDLVGFDISDEEKAKRFNKKDENGVAYEEWELRKRGADSRRIDSPNLWFPIYYSETLNDISLEKNTSYEIEITPKLSDGTDGRWRWSKQKVLAEKDKLYVRKNNKGVYNIYERKNIEEKSKQLAPTIWDFSDVNTELGTKLVKGIFDNKAYFDFPKPLGLINRIISLFDNKNLTVLDFFSGSGTTAHSVYHMNSLDGGNRKFILVQLPENVDKSSEAYSDGYRTICEIGEERIRRSGKMIAGEDGLLTNNLDIGFRVLKLDSSNMKDVYYNPKDVRLSLLEEYVDNVKEDRTPLDLLFQTMLDLGVDLSAKIEEKQVGGSTLYVVNESYLVACFDKNIDDEVVKAAANIKPVYVVFRDASFNSDSSNINCEQTIKIISPSTELKVI